MSDWVIDNDDTPQAKITNPSDWELAPDDNSSTSLPKTTPTDEALPVSILKAPGRVASDLYKGTTNFVKNIPGYFQSAQTEIPGVFNTLQQHPVHAAMQALAGSQEMINNLAQLPKQLAQYGSNRLNLLSPDIANAISKITPQDTTSSINSLFGQPQYPGEALIRGTVRNLPNIVGGSELMSALPPLTRGSATRVLNQARELAQGRNIGALNVNPELIEDARQFLPNTLPHRNALNAAQAGDYNNLFQLQSDVGRNASDYARSLFSAAERSHGRAGLEARNRLLDAIHENLQSQGHYDISDMLRRGQNDYRRYMAFRPYRNILGGAALTAALAGTIPNNPIVNIASKILSHRTQ